MTDERAQPSDGGVAGEPVAPGWIDRNYQIDRYGVALMMIREGCSDPAGLARRILSEFSALPPVPGNEGREKEITRLATIEECAQVIESGAGMADLIDQEELDQQAKYIRGLAVPRSEGKTP